ncbi:ankyrin repeat domain-containing protein [Candidatus Tisiphia endosymbiont of Myopa tessellatipennis]|uniref:ankyrin repeat domain-containing protein n=1 Tax=Candidatus Tisiphia endosymbiont of Myopa tessellatipennis TaxID=3066257 RepID=UPI00313D335F
MAKIKITEKERNSYISNKSFLEHALIYAIRARDKKTLELLNSRCPDFNSFIKIKLEDLFKELMYLVTNDKHEKIVKLIINKFDISLSQQRDQRGATLLNEAACYGAAKIVSFLLKKGFDPNNQDFYGHTPLHHAITVNSLGTVILLVKHPKIDLNVQDQDGNTPLHLSIFHKDYSILTTLKDVGAKQNVANKRGYNYLELYKALTKGSAKVTMPNLQPPEEKENIKFYEGMANFYKGILSDGNQGECFVRAINSIKTFLNELPISHNTIDFAYESLWALAKLYEYYKYKDCKDSNKLQKYIIDKAEAWGLCTASETNALEKINTIIDTNFEDFYKIILQLKSQNPPSTILQSLVKHESNSKDQGLKDTMLQVGYEPHSYFSELLKNWDFARLQNNDLKNEEIIETDETSYLSSLPKEPECSTITQELDLAAMGLAEEERKALGVDSNDTSVFLAS